LAASTFGAQQPAFPLVSGMGLISAAFKEDRGVSFISERRKSSRLLSSPGGGLEQQSDIQWLEVTPVLKNVNRDVRITGDSVRKFGLRAVR
jgi:hypothetical protein